MEIADMAIFAFSCTYERTLVALCSSSIEYQPIYFFSRYPSETTKVWNLLNLLSPSSWMWTLSSIISIVIMLKLFTIVGSYLGSVTKTCDINLVPIR